MNNLNPLYTILNESKEYRKEKYGENFKKHEELIKAAKKKREQISAAKKPSKTWASGTRFELSQLGKASELPERKLSARGKVADETIKKAKKLVDKNFTQKKNMKGIVELTKKGIAKIVTKGKR